VKGCKGSAYITVLMVALILSVLAVGIISAVMSDYKIAMADSHGSEAYYIADGGATAMVYELEERIKSEYEQVKAEAQAQQAIPVDEYISKHFYERLPLTYPPDGYRRIDFEDHAGCYSQASASFDSGTGIYTVLSKGYAGNASSAVKVQLKVNTVFPSSPALDIFSKAVVAVGELGADRDDIVINGDAVVLGGFDTSFNGGNSRNKSHTITINGDLYVPESMDITDADVDVNGRIVRMSQDTISQLLSIINSFQSLLPLRTVEAGQGTLEDPKFIESSKDGPITVDRNDDGFSGVIYSDGDLRIKINKDDVALNGAIIANGDFYSKQNPHEGTLIINYDQRVVANLIDGNGSFKDFYSHAVNIIPQQEEELVEIGEWKAVQP